jgi:predicted amidohydrolase
MNIALGNPQKNLVQAERLIAEASQRKSRLIVLPELWSSGYALEQAKDYASELNKGVFAQLSTWATQYKISIVGSILEKRGLEVANSAPFFAPNGRMMGVYRKVHLFGLMDEDKYLQPGSALVALDLPWGTIGFGICYDLRFPEMFRHYALNDRARLLIIPAEWPQERLAHWQALLVARAIENQCYIVACNAAGETGNTTFGGHSAIIDPWGRTVIQGGYEPNLLTAEIELDLVDDARKRISALQDVRNDLYGA